MAETCPHLDHHIIAEIVAPGSRVLDLGCGDGDLLHLLLTTRKTKVQGIEVDDKCIYKCVEKGLNVLHSDIDSGLKGYPDQSFDYVVLNQSLQEVKKVDYVVDESLRVGKRVIIGFPNFAHYKARWKLGIQGQAPMTESLPYEWHETPNLRFLSILDFETYCRRRHIRVLARHYLAENRRIHLLPNAFALTAIYVLDGGRGRGRC